MTAASRLLRFEDAAKILDVPAPALRKVADEHGLTVIIGRAVRLHPDDLGKLIEKCRVKQRAQGYSGSTEAHTVETRIGKSGTAQRACPPALTAAKMLKNLSRNTSSENIAQLVQLHPTK